jgi:ABC-type multidrug transport system ATPase subunit
MGPNGTGKSTLLRCIAGLLVATEGTVRLPEGDSRRVMALSALEMALYPALTCSEHLCLAADLRGCGPRDAELLKRVGLESAANLRANQLSTGMKSRLKLALAIQPSPLLLLLDEPGAALDESGRSLLDSIVAEQAERGVVLFATNDPSERRLANLELPLEHTGAAVA